MLDGISRLILFFVSLFGEKDYNHTSQIINRGGACVDIQQLKYFQTVAQLGQVTQAADNLHISQPALSAVITRIEKEVGVKLFDREGRNIVLNEYGQLLLRFADETLERYETFQKKVAHLRYMDDSMLSLAVTGTSFPSTALRDFLVENPQIQLRQSLIEVEEVPYAAKRKDLDFVISSSPCTDADLHCKVLWSEALYLVLPKTHALADKTSIDLRSLENELFICLPKGYVYRSLTDSICEEAGFTPKVGIDAFIDQVPLFVNKGLGIAIITESTLKNGGLDELEVVVKPFTGATNYRYIYLVWEKEMIFHQAASRFYQYIKSWKET